MADAEVIHLPEKWTQTCYACAKAMFGDGGTYCPVFSEMIVSENLAGQDCPEFVAEDGKAYVRVE